MLTLPDNLCNACSLAFAAMLFFETVPVKLCGRSHPAHNDCRDGPRYGCPRVPFWRCNIYGISGAPASMPAPQGTCSPAGSRSPHEICWSFSRLSPGPPGAWKRPQWDLPRCASSPTPITWLSTARAQPSGDLHAAQITLSAPPPPSLLRYAVNVP